MLTSPLLYHIYDWTCVHRHVWCFPCWLLLLSCVSSDTIFILLSLYWCTHHIILHSVIRFSVILFFIVWLLFLWSNPLWLLCAAWYILISRPAILFLILSTIIDPPISYSPWSDQYTLSRLVFLQLNSLQYDLHIPLRSVWSALHNPSPLYSTLIKSTFPIYELTFTEGISLMGICTLGCAELKVWKHYFIGCKVFIVSQNILPSLIWNNSCLSRRWKTICIGKKPERSQLVSLI